MKLYNFERLIKKYSGDFTLVSTAKGEYIGGKYVEGEKTETGCKGAFVPMSERKIYQSGGTYTSKDYTLYMTEPIPKAFETVKAIYKGNEYNIEQATDYEDYADAYIYNAKWVSAVSD